MITGRSPLRCRWLLSLGSRICRICATALWRRKRLIPRQSYSRRLARRAVTGRGTKPRALLLCRPALTSLRNQSARYTPAPLFGPTHGSTESSRTAPDFPGSDLRPAEVLVEAGLRHPAAVRHGDGRGNVSHRHAAARGRSRALERGLCAAFAASY